MMNEPLLIIIINSRPQFIHISLVFTERTFYLASFHPNTTLHLFTMSSWDPTGSVSFSTFLLLMALVVWSIGQIL